MNEEEFKKRTRDVGLRIARLSRVLPRERVADVIAMQVVRCGMSIGANYRAACRGRSVADVIAKLKIVEEEADETEYWLENLIDLELVSAKRLAPLIREVSEILAMTVASIRTLRKRG